ncbi:uncharacterized protein Pyn_15187 [Prunus yedoensis var. nudiflora]|uniref:Peptidoglycan binding-like domain-containing protein n=1 Tax=Prunus yedoensis var. nudiflora TaxID=2094558 RepID=A0A314XW47_PRUYE|nr:uncharacterized protein Pyn_15187 [Prunus yedoensis var. nudiflora]
MTETGLSSRAIELDHIQEEIEEVSAVPLVKETKKSINALRKGSEGEEVRAMQDALQKLGFYSVEEDMEFSSFSSGTECAVKTWQEDTNGVAVTSAIEISEVQQTLVKEGVTKVEVSEHHVFLLGENRWEDSSRLSRNRKKGGESKTMNTTTRCLTCQGRNVMEQASQTLKNSSSWIGWKREQNVHIVKVMGLQFATYVKRQQ